MPQEPQTKPASPKPWYKEWWGILILIIVWPISLSVLLIHLIWNKTKWNKGVKIVASLLVVIVVASAALSALADSDSSSSSSTATEQTSEVETDKDKTAPPETGSTGDDVILQASKNPDDCSGLVIVARTEDTLDKSIDASIADDSFGQAELLINDQIFTVPSCTKARVIDRKFATSRVRILEGEHIAEAGWLPYEFAIIHTVKASSTESINEETKTE